MNATKLTKSFKCAALSRLTLPNDFILKVLFTEDLVEDEEAQGVTATGGHDPGERHPRGEAGDVRLAA